MKRFLNKPLRILLYTNILILLSAAMFAPMYAVYVQRIGGDLLDAGITGGLFAFTAGVVMLTMGKYADHVKHKERVVIAGYLMIGVGFLLYLLVHSIWQLFWVQVLIGFGEACYTPAFDGLYSEHIGNERLASSRWGAWEASHYFSIAIGAAAGGAIVKYLGFNVLFILMAALSFTSALYLLRLPKRVLD